MLPPGSDLSISSSSGKIWSSKSAPRRSRSAFTLGFKGSGALDPADGETSVILGADEDRTVKVERLESCRRAVEAEACPPVLNPFFISDDMSVLKYSENDAAVHFSRLFLI